MKRRILLCLIFLATSSLAVPDLDLSPVPEVPVGDYRIIGSKPDAQGCFEGTCKIKRKKNGRYVLIRRVAGKSVVSDIAVRRVIENAFEVVCNFSQDGIEYESRYNYSLDSNNYARLTGAVARKDGKSKKCGLEALFATTHNPGAGGASGRHSRSHGGAKGN